MLTLLRMWALRGLYQVMNAIAHWSIIWVRIHCKNWTQAYRSLLSIERVSLVMGNGLHSTWLHVKRCVRIRRSWLIHHSCRRCSSINVSIVEGIRGLMMRGYRVIVREGPLQMVRRQLLIIGSVYWVLNKADFWAIAIWSRTAPMVRMISEIRVIRLVRVLYKDLHWLVGEGYRVWVVRVLCLIKMGWIVTSFVEQLVVSSVKATIHVDIGAVVHYINTFQLLTSL